MDWLDLDETEAELAIGAWIAARGRVEDFEKIIGTSVASADVEALAAKLGAWVLAPFDADFPPRVRDKLRTPLPWFARGTIPDGLRLAVVGSRDVDREGERIAGSIARDVASSGVVVVSGGANGVDTIAHQAALSVGGATVAVLPSAFDRPTPARNKPLFDRIADGGGMLISEYPPGVTAHRFHFHRRNEIIAAMCDAVLVVRAKTKSGTMLTANAALRIGTPVLAVPGSPEDETAAGCNRLLRRGARCVTSADEVLEELGVSSKAAPVQTRLPLDLSSNARTVLAELNVPRTVDELCVVASRPPHEILIALTELELANAVQADGARWRSKSLPMD